MQRALGAHERLTEEFTTLVRSASDGAHRVRNSTWTVGEVGAHVLGGLRLYPNILSGECGGWDSLGAGDVENAKLLDRTPEREPSQIADAITNEARACRAAFASYSSDLAPWHEGIQAPPAALVGLLVGEMVAHGWDIARSLGLPWRIDPPDASLVFASTIPVMHHFVVEDKARGFSAVFAVRLRAGPAFTLSFSAGQLAASEGWPTKADCRMSVEPVAYLLTAYGRIPPWRPALKGQMLVYGRRPWLGLKLTSVLVGV